MKNKKSHTIYKLVAAVILLCGISLLSQFVAFFHIGADPKNILNLGKEVFQDHCPFVIWEDNEDLIGLSLDEFTEDKIEGDYLMAWSMLNRSIKENEFSTLEDYFCDSLRQRIMRQTAFNEDMRFEQVDLEHHLKPSFFSFDRKIISFEDSFVKVKKRAYKKESKTPIYAREETSHFKIIMMLEDGFWKIHEMQKVVPSFALSEIFSQSTSKNKFRIVGDELLLNNRPFHMQGINYYPQHSPWSLFWENFDKAEFERDLALMKKANFNTLRFFIPFEEFGGAHVKPNYLTKLGDLLSSLEDFDMYALITLFDFPTGFEWDQFTKADQHLRIILKKCQEYDAVLAYDLKNEPDLDIKLYGEAVEDWLSFLISRFRKYNSEALLTIGWSDENSVDLFADKLDFISFHYYNSDDDLRSTIQKLKSKFPDRLLVLEEFGFPSYKSKLWPIHKTQKRQKEYVANVLDITGHENVPCFLWTLYDFPKIPDQVFSSKPWLVNSQKHFGLYDQEGKAKPVLALFIKEKDEIKSKFEFPYFILTWLASLLLIAVVFKFGIHSYRS